MVASENMAASVSNMFLAKIDCGTVKIFSMLSRSLLHQLGRDVKFCQLSPDGQLLLTVPALASGQLCVWATKTWNCIATKDIQQNTFSCFSCCLSDRVAVVVQRQVSVRDARTLQDLFVVDFESFHALVSVLAETLVISGFKTVRLFDLKSQCCFRTCYFEPFGVRPNALSPDQTMLASLIGNGHCRATVLVRDLLDENTPQLMAVDLAKDFAFLPDSLLIVAVATTMRVFAPRTGTVLRTIESHQSDFWLCPSGSEFLLAPSGEVLVVFDYRQTWFHTIAHSIMNISDTPAKNAKKLALAILRPDSIPDILKQIW